MLFSNISFYFPLIFNIHFRLLIDWNLFFFWQTAAELLCCVPDIACFAKLMTGGIVPLAATLATNAVFNTFIGESKVFYGAGFFFCIFFNFGVSMKAFDIEEILCRKLTCWLGSILLAATFVAFDVLDCISDFTLDSEYDKGMTGSG